jgi:hypothetical protein
MTTLKQILCAIINFGHKYEPVKKVFYFNRLRLHFFEEEMIEIPEAKNYFLKCSCGKVWERKR